MKQCPPYYSQELRNGDWDTMPHGHLTDCAEQECDSVRQVDIKTSIKNEIRWLTASIENYKEKLRVANEKLRLINKNKDLEAYINLDRMR